MDAYERFIISFDRDADRHAENVAESYRLEAEKLRQKKDTIVPKHSNADHGSRMIYTAMTKKALRIAFDAHKEQVDKTGLPYVFHPFHLAEQMCDEVSVCTALLHDVVEDTSITFDDLLQAEISDEVIVALRLLTHDPSIPYIDYIKAIKNSGNRTAIRVKLADLYHNSDITRLETVDERMWERLAKYRAAINCLEA